MKIALGRLGWAPPVFWSATPQEFWAAFEDWVEVNCIQKDDGALSEEEIERLEAMKRRFPDRVGAAAQIGGPRDFRGGGCIDNKQVR